MEQGQAQKFRMSKKAIQTSLKGFVLLISIIILLLGLLFFYGGTFDEKNINRWQALFIYAGAVCFCLFAFTGLFATSKALSFL